MAQIITIDGDRYAVTLPSYQLHKDLCKDKKMVSVFQSLGDDIGLPVIDCAKINDHDRGVFSSVQPTIIFFQYDIRNPQAYTAVMQQSYLAYRPVLIPLNKEGLPDQTLKRQNPNGSVSVGGRFAFSPSPYDAPFKARSVFTHKPLANGFLGFQDSCVSQENLTWVWWNGILILAKPSLELPPEAVLSQDMISDLLFSDWL